MIAPERERKHTHKNTDPALLTWQRSWYFIKIKYSEPNINKHMNNTYQTLLIGSFYIESCLKCIDNKMLKMEGQVNHIVL